MKTLAILFTIFYFLNALAVAPYGIKGQEQSSTLYSNVHQFPNNQVTNLGGINALVETGNKNILSNPSFEHSTTDYGWTTTTTQGASLAVTTDSSTQISGKKSVVLTCTMGGPGDKGDCLFYQDVPTSKSIQGLASIYIEPISIPASVSKPKVYSRVNGTNDKYVEVGSDSVGLYKIPVIEGTTSTGIAIYFTGAPSSVVSVRLDDSFVGAQDLKQDINNIGPWTSFTPTGSWTANSPVYVGKYRQVGESMEIKWELTLGGAVTVSELELNIPPGFTIDTAKALSIATNSPFGYAKILDAGSSVYDAVVVGSTSSTSVIVRAIGASGTYTTAGAVLTATVPMTWASGDKVVAFASIPVTQFSGSTSIYSTPADTFSTDTNTLTHKDTSIVDSDPIGTYNTYSYAANTNTKTICATAPSVAPTKADGFKIFTRAYNVASTCGNPARVEIKLANAGTSLPTLSKEIYKSAGKVTAGNMDYGWDNSGGSRGARLRDYNENTGILIVDAGLQESPANTAALFRFVDTTTQNNGYLVINAQKAKEFIIGDFDGLEKCTDSYECTDTFSAKVSAAGVVSDENLDWINGNCTVSPVGTYTCNFGAGLFSVTPNCTATADGGVGGVIVRFSSYSNTLIAVNLRTNSSAAATEPFTLTCQKQGVDYIGKTAKAVASDQNLRTPGVTKAVVYSAHVTDGASVGTVDYEIGDFINGDCTNASAGAYFCTFNTGVFSSSPICSATVNSGSSYNQDCGVSESSTGITLQCHNNNSLADRHFRIICHGVSP